MTWFAFHGYGTINVAGAQEKNLVAWGFHGYGTKQMADSHPNSVNVIQKPIVNSAEQDYKTAVGSGEQPGGPQSNLGGAVTNPGKFFGGTLSSEIAHGFNFGNIILRVGEVVLGIVLIGVGIAKLTGTNNLVAAAVRTKI